jgi:hypothetical protein
MSENVCRVWRYCVAVRLLSHIEDEKNDPPSHLMNPSK